MFNCPTARGNIATMNREKNSHPKLVAFINSDVNKRNNESPEFMMLQSGYANGYVAIPPSHPDYGKNLMDDESIEVHGGVTFCESYATCKKRFKNMEFIGEASGVKGHWWVIGFDTCHFLDSLERCPREYVIKEVNHLKSQLEQRWN